MGMVLITPGLYGLLSGTRFWSWLVPLILVGGGVVFVIAYYRSSTFQDSFGEAIEAVLDVAPSKAVASKTIIRPVTTEEYYNIIARIGSLFTTKRYVPQSQSSGLYVFQKQEAPRGCLMIFIHIIVALILFALCIIPGIIYLVVIFSRGDKIRVASVQITPLQEGYSFNIKAPGGIKRKIYEIIGPYAVGVTAEHPVPDTQPGVPMPTGQVFGPQTNMSMPAAPPAPMLTSPAPAPGVPVSPVPSTASFVLSDPPGPPAAETVQPGGQVQVAAGPMVRSSGLEADEKECPFCAEVIKAKAIKCKHCGSNL